MPQNISFEDAALQVARAISDSTGDSCHLNVSRWLHAWSGSWGYMRQTAKEYGIVLVPGRPEKFDAERDQ